MSLKAKIEAVIYASEEPVTLAQLTGLLGQEGQSELDQLDSAQQSLAFLGEPTAELDDEASGEAAPLPEADIEGDTSVSISAQAEGRPSSMENSPTNAAYAAEPTGPESTELESTEPRSEGAGAEEPELQDLRPETPSPTEPEPEETVSDQEPEPTESSPIPEHPEMAEATVDQPEGSEAESAKQNRIQKQDEKLRERRLRDYFRTIVDELIADYSTSARGLEIREVAGGYRLSTKPEYHDAVRGFVKSLKPPLKLSLQALETLAVVAYKQPVTAPEISEIRGVDSGGVLGSLMARKLITTAGRKQVIGRPILYKTTRDFLLRFGLKDVSELPSIEEFEKMAGELADVEPVQEEIPMPRHVPESSDELEAEREEVEPQSDGDSIPLDGSDEPSLGVPSETVADEVLTDGRISGLLPRYDLNEQGPNEEAPFDSPAMDAELQQEQAEEEAVAAQETK